MTSREKFEAWMTAEQWFHGSDFEWDERRNCYAQFGIHLAYKAFMAAEGAAEQKRTDMAVQLANAESKCRELAAENVGQKSGVTYFAFAPECGFDYFANKQDAIDTAQAEIDAYRDDAFDGWDEDVRRVSWGIVIQRADGVDADGVHISDSRHTYQTCDYQLVDMVKSPASDAFLAEVRAQSASELIAAFSKHVSASGLNDSSVVTIRECEDAMQHVAAQIRKGAAL